MDKYSKYIDIDIKFWIGDLLLVPEQVSNCSLNCAESRDIGRLETYFFELPAGDFTQHMWTLLTKSF